MYAYSSFPSSRVSPGYSFTEPFNTAHPVHAIQLSMDVYLKARGPCCAADMRKLLLFGGQLGTVCIDKQFLSLPHFCLAYSRPYGKTYVELDNTP